jgi:hypothetical protein
LKFFINLLNKYLDFTENSKTLAAEKIDDFMYSNRPYWLLLRCSKCNKKSIPMVNKGVVVPVSPYCRHCGSEKFYLDKKNDIERLDTIYALYYKDLNNVRKEMVSANYAQMDKEMIPGYVSQSTSGALDVEAIRQMDNVVPFEKYYTKK